MLNKFFSIILSFIIYFSFLNAQEIAVVTKKNGIVKYKKDSSKIFKNRINIGMELYNNDLLITGKDGFVMFAYLDDGSLIKVYRDSEVYVTGDLKNKMIDKKIIIDDGFFKFDIKKQKKDEFKVVTPTSVASVKGTKFYINTSDEGDIFYGIDGIVEILNIESNKISKLSKLKKITSSIDGTILMGEINAEDISYLNQIQQESGIKINEIESFDNKGSELGMLDINNLDAVKKISINFINPSGENKKLIVKFTQD